MAIICNNKRTFHRVPVCSKLPPKCISAVCWFFCHPIHPFRSTLSVKPAVFFSTQSHRSGSRSITEGGCPAPLSHQPLQTQAPPAALPAVNQNSSLPPPPGVHRFTLQISSTAAFPLLLYPHPALPQLWYNTLQAELVCRGVRRRIAENHHRQIIQLSGKS